jgi:hypothetical protein
MHMIFHVLIDVPIDERFGAQQIRDHTRDEVNSALSRAAVDIGTILSVETASCEQAEDDHEPLPADGMKGGR